MSADEAVAYPTQTVVACEACGVTVDVTWYCKNCPGSLCGSCKDSHKTTGITSKHSVVPRTGTVVRTHGPAKIAEQCRHHPVKEISAYCNKCKVPCCISCLAEKHKQHDFSPIEEKYLAAEKRLDDYTKQLEKDVIPKLEEMETQISSEVKDEDQQREKVKEEVNAFREEIKQVVDEACDSLIEALCQPKSDLKDVIHDINRRKKKVNELMQSCTDKVKEGKLDMIEYAPPTPESLLPTLTPPMSSTPMFAPGREIVNVIKNKIGSIHYVENKKQKTAAPSSPRLSSPQQKFDKSIINVRKIKSFRSTVGTSSITTAGNNTAWMMDYGNGTMYLYSDSGEVVRSVTVIGSIGINDMAITPSGKMIVTNRDKKVRCVSVSGEVSTLIDTASFDAFGMCLTDREEIVVCMSGQGEKNQLAVYSDRGNKVHEINGRDNRGKKLLTHPYRVVQNGKYLCIVNLSESSNILCVDESDDVRWVYDGTQAKLKARFNPHCIDRDKYHNLLVTDDLNHCVHYLDREGQLIQIILRKDQIGLDWGISVDDETGQVWVGNFNKNVVVAKYLQV